MNQSASEGSSIDIGSWITCDSKLSNLGKLTLENGNLKKLGVKYYISEKDLGRFLSRQSTPIAQNPRIQTTCTEGRSATFRVQGFVFSFCF